MLGCCPPWPPYPPERPRDRLRFDMNTPTPPRNNNETRPASSPAACRRARRARRKPENDPPPRRPTIKTGGQDEDSATGSCESRGQRGSRRPHHETPCERNRHHDGNGRRSTKMNRRNLIFLRLRLKPKPAPNTIRDGQSSERNLGKKFDWVQTRHPEINGLSSQQSKYPKRHPNCQAGGAAMRRHRSKTQQTGRSADFLDPG